MKLTQTDPDPKHCCHQFEYFITGMVEEGRLVLDPFVGTGSLLLAAAEFKGIINSIIFIIVKLFITLHTK